MIFTRHLRVLLVVVAVFVLNSPQLFASDPQNTNSRVDSLWNVIHTHPNDTCAVEAYIALAGEVLYDNPAQAESYCRAGLDIALRIGWAGGRSECYGWIAYLMEQRGAIDSALYYYDISLDLARKFDDKKDQAAILNNIAAIDKDKGLINEALELYDQSLALRSEIGDVGGMSSTYSNIGLIYQNQGQIEEALRYYNMSLHVDDSIGNKPGVATDYLNIATVYRDQGEYESAMTNLHQSLSISKELGDKYSEGYAYALIGNVYRLQKQNDSALENFRTSYDLRASIDDQQGMAYCLKYIGNVYEEQDSIALAKNCYRQSLTIFEQQEDQWGIASVQYLIGNLFFKEGNLDSAQYLGEQSLKNAQELGYPANIRDAAGLLAGIYRNKQNWEAALKMNELFVKMRDSVQNEETRKAAIKNKFQADFDKKSAVLKTESEAKINQERLQRNAFIGGFILVLMLVFVLYNRYKIKTNANVELAKKNEIISTEKDRSDKLLLNILPLYVANELKETGTAKAKNHESATVMFTDFKDFTKVAERLSPEELVREINFCFSEFDRIIGNYRIEKVKTIGDAYMCAGGIPQGFSGHASEIVKAAIDIRDFMAELYETKTRRGEDCFQVRIGVATGPVVAGVVGIKKFAYDIWGDTVNVAARMESHGEAGKVNISESTYELIKDEFNCEYRGEIDAKNKGKVKMYFVEKKSS